MLSCLTVHLCFFRRSKVTLKPDRLEVSLLELINVVIILGV